MKEEKKIMRRGIYHFSFVVKRGKKIRFDSHVFTGESEKEIFEKIKVFRNKKLETTKIFEDLNLKTDEILLTNYGNYQVYEYEIFNPKNPIYYNEKTLIEKILN